MSIIVNTPGGNIGRALTGYLLDAGADVTIISRHPEKVTGLVDRGAKLVKGSVDDPDVLNLALQEGAALFWLTPPNFRPDFRDWACHSAEQAADIARENGVERIVLLSSTGAHSGPGAGPVSILGEVEKVVLNRCENVMVMRPAYFMENLLIHLSTIARDGAFYLPVPAQKAFPMVATRDIANVAAGWLLDENWTGHRTIGVHGPEDLSHARAAEILSAELGRSIAFVEITPDQMRQALQDMGTPDVAVGMYLELYEAMSAGRLDPAEPRTAETTTNTSLAQFAREILKPAMGQAAQA